ncbi:MAG: GDSL-type esterase/lipase family protein [bacterium]
MINDSIKTILCYGDSNTWGNIPKSDFRYPRSVRWPSALQNFLGDGYEVVGEGLCGRTLKSSVASPEKNGINYILPCVLSHEPLDWVIIMLGTNDVKDSYNLSAENIAENLKETILIIKNADMVNKEDVKILVVCPPEIIATEKGIDTRFIEGIEKFKKLPELYKKVALDTEAHFLNASDFVQSSKVDGFHLDADAHLKLAEAIRGILFK